MYFRKHIGRANYGIYALWQGNEEDLHPLVEEASNFLQAEELALNYLSPSGPVVIVDSNGEIVSQYNETTDLPEVQQ